LYIISSTGVVCPQPAAPLNARVSVGGVSPGSLSTYTCDSGYDLFGSDSVVCGGDGKWTGVLPVCATNVAYRKPVNQSSTARGGDGENANDGDLTTLHDGDRCTQTLTETSPWWAVDLLQQYEVSVVRITARGCCDSLMTSHYALAGHEPLQDLEVRVGDSVNYHQNRLCAWLPGVIDEGSTRDLTCARPMLGRYVMVQMVGVSGSMSLCEVQVFSTQEVSKERCLDSSLLGSLATFNRTCYQFQTQQGGTYEVAKDKCAARKATLVQHIAPITQDFLTSELKRMESSMTSKLLWIGVEKEPKHTSRIWRWIDGTEVKKPLWARDQPNNYIGDQNCVMLDGSKNWRWNDIKCSLNYVHWICQYSAPSCGSPDKRENTTVTVTKEDLQSEGREVATYTCPEGNKVIGDTNRTCGLDGLWAGEAPSCKYIDCSSPESVEHGKVVLLDGRTTYAARALYACAENYTLDGEEDTIMCGDDGEWEPAAPHCLFSWCPALEAPRDGGLEVTGRRAGDTAVFLCNPGYTLIGAKTVSCQLGGQWSGGLPTCRFVDCGIPDDLEHGEMTLANGTTYLDSVAYYECDADYWLDGPKERTCLKDGRWTGDVPFCVLINCGEPEIPHGGYVTGYSFDVGAEVQYHCEAGHYSTGEMRRVCSRDASWSGDAPNCTFVDCGRVLPLVRGEVKYLNEGDASYLGSQVQHVCNLNYRLTGDEIRTCMKDGQWSGVAPRCEEIRCSNPVVPELARISISRNDRRLSSVVRGHADMQPDHSYKVGSTITYRCDKGYVVDGVTLRTCGTNGTWSGEAPTCKFVDCGLPDPISPGVFRLPSNETSYGASVSYECDPNWKVEGRFRRFCLENGTWSGPTPKCIQIQCPELSSMAERSSEGLEVEEGPRTVGSFATYSCSPGYSMLGETKRGCMQHGVWAAEKPSCQAVVCPEPEQILNGRMIKLNSTTAFGSVVEYLCFPKYHLHGAFQRTCTQQGTWSTKPPTCSLDDDDRGILDDNTVDGSTNSARGSSDGDVDESSNSGLVAGIVVSLILVAAVAVALAFFRTRQRKLAKTGGVGGQGKAPDGGPINGVSGG
ncbi:C-type lectin-like, partial [Trinorchestia longiramus]